MSPLDKKEIVKKLASSSLLLQFRVADILKQHGWKVSLEYSYKDLVEMKARPADIVAKKYIGNGQDVAMGLTIECKYLFKKNLVVFKDSTKSFTKNGISRHPAIKTKNSQLRTYLEQGGSHHYLAQDLHVLQDLISENKDKVDVIYEAFCKATKPIMQFFISEDQKIVWYPIVVIGGNEIYSYDLDNLSAGISEKKLENIKHCLFEYSFSRTPERQPETFIIDITHESFFEEFLSTVLNQDMKIFEAFSSNKNNERAFQNMMKSGNGANRSLGLARKI